MDRLIMNIEHALKENETDVDALKELFKVLKQEYPLAYIDEAYNAVIKKALYGE